MNPADCGYPQSASLLPADDDCIIAYHVRVNVWYMRFQYNIVNCKVAIIWFILCQWLQPASGTDCVEPSCVWVCAAVKSCWGICINYSALILILKYNKPSMLAIGLESDAVWEHEWGGDAITIFSQEHFLNLRQHWIMKMPSPNRSIHSLNSREMCRGSRMPDGDLNLPLNKGSYRLYNTWACISGRFCPAQIACVRVNIHTNLYVCAGDNISGTLQECVCVFVRTRVC